MANVFLLFIGAVLLLSPLNKILGSAGLATVLEVIPLIALSFWFWKKRRGSEPFALPPGSLALLVVVGWGILQLIPLPLSLVKFLSPHAWQTYQQSVGALVSSPWVSLSLYPKGTLQAVLTLCSGISCYFLTAKLLQDRRCLKQAALWLTGIAGVVAAATMVLYCIKQFYGQNMAADSELIAFLQNDFTSLGLLQLLLGPLALASMLAVRPSSRYGTLQERMTSYWQATVQDHFLIVALSALTIPFCLALLDWHNALIYLLALGLLWVLLFIKKRGRRGIPYFLVVLLLLISGLVVGLYSKSDIEASPAIQKVQTDPSIANRVVAQYPLTGSGLGTYEKLYQRHDRQGTGQEGTLIPHPFVIRARAEIGWVSVVAAIWFIATLIWRVLPEWRSRRNKLAIYFFAGSLGGLLSFILAVAMLELSIPVWLGYYAFVLAGFVVAASQSSYHLSVQDDYLPNRYDRRYFLGTLFATGVLVIGLLFHGGGLLAKEIIGTSQVADGQNGRRSFPEERLLVHAALSDPLEASYRRSLAWRLSQQGRSRQAMSYFSSALRLDPLAGLEIYRMGMYMADAGYGNAATKLMQHGLNNEWSNQVLQVDFVTRLLINGEKTRALNHVRQILATDPSRTLEWLIFLNKKGLEVTEEAAVLAGHARCYIDFGEFLLEKDYPELAADSYDEALRILQGTEAFQPELVWRLAAFFEARQEYEKALTAVLAGTRLYPEDLTMMQASGRLHERLGLTFKAAEIYRKILMHTPQDLDLRRHLNQLVDQRH